MAQAIGRVGCATKEGVCAVAPPQGVPGEDGGILLATIATCRAEHGGIPGRARKVDNSANAIPTRDAAKRDY